MAFSSAFARSRTAVRLLVASLALVAGLAPAARRDAVAARPSRVAAVRRDPSTTIAHVVRGAIAQSAPAERARGERPPLRRRGSDFGHGSLPAFRRPFASSRLAAVPIRAGAEHAFPAEPLSPYDATAPPGDRYALA